MKKLLYACSFLTLLGCGNEVEEITNPTTGTVLKRYEYYFDENGQKVKDGTYTEWNQDGTMKWTCIYKDGKQHGEEKVYLKSDSIIHNNFKDGERDGISQIIYKDVIIRKLNYSKGLLEGKQLYYYPNGKLKTEGYTKNNLTTNVWKHYDSNGKLVATFNYNDFHIPKELIGKWVQQTNNGTQVYYEFDETGSAKFYGPMFRYQKNATLLMSGLLLIGAKFHVTDGGKEIIMDIVSLEKDKLVLENQAGEIKTLIKQQN